MTQLFGLRQGLRLHVTNVAGAGATQLVQSLLPALEGARRVAIERIDLPDRGALSRYQSKSPSTTVCVYKRRLPNALSRALECTLFGAQFDGNSPLLVLGDLPLRCTAPQTVFVQTPHLLSPCATHLRAEAVKYSISRTIFKANALRARAFIVQTDVMRDALIKTYPEVVGRVHVIPQPVPSWLLNQRLRRRGRLDARQDKLSLIYPAAGYPHKNHSLLSEIDASLANDWPVQQLTLTLDPSINPSPQISWVHCSGFLSPSQMIDAYGRTDGLLFLSREESYGFPLIEAMFVGLPIICPDLPYARTLCGEEATYFDPVNPESLRRALCDLKARLDAGWWPSWNKQLTRIPNDWDAVASQMIDVACG